MGLNPSKIKLVAQAHSQIPPGDKPVCAAGKPCRYTFLDMGCQLLSHNMLGILLHTPTIGCGKPVERGLCEYWKVSL
jgi:hypothetical protein